MLPAVVEFIGVSNVDGSTIYSHMTAKHGGWYRNQAFGAGNNDDDDYYTDDDDDYY